ncbi:MAG: HEPN domain-containing protein [Nanoarchaeota archaeon]
MVSIKWCCKQREGIELIEPNDNLAKSYIRMAEDSIETMNREKKYNSIFAISACYYSMYYSVYSILMKIGVKCKIHQCTLELMKFILPDFFSDKDIKLIKKAFDLRNISQYYVNKIILKEDTEFIIENAQLFLDKSKDILSRLTEKEIFEMRNKIKNLQN